MHPGGIGAEERLWFGTEAEGVRRGRETAFVAGALSNDETLRINTSSVTDVFLTETFGTQWDWDWFEHWGAYKRRTYVITIGRFPSQLEEFFSLPWRHELRLMVRVFDAPWVEKLRSNDQVSVGVPYRMVTFENRLGYASIPSDYSKDAL